MTVKTAIGEVMFHEVALEKITIEGATIAMEVDDSNTQRWKFSFFPYQAIRVTTADCAEYSPFVIEGRRPLHLLEVMDSEWIHALKKQLQLIDDEATFMEKAPLCSTISR